jgi:hypothetical protein
MIKGMDSEGNMEKKKVKWQAGPGIRLKWNGRSGQVQQG